MHCVPFIRFSVEILIFYQSVCYISVKLWIFFLSYTFFLQGRKMYVCLYFILYTLLFFVSYLRYLEKSERKTYA